LLPEERFAQRTLVLDACKPNLNDRRHRGKGNNRTREETEAATAFMQSSSYPRTYHVTHRSAARRGLGMRIRRCMGDSGGVRGEQRRHRSALSGVTRAAMMSPGSSAF